jgi:hypothetical protein
LQHFSYIKLQINYAKLTCVRHGCSSRNVACLLHYIHKCLLLLSVLSDSDNSGVRQAADMQPSSTVSFVAALQQLGHSCGESVMAADLAAFVTHKLLHAGDVKGAREQGKHSGAGEQQAHVATLPAAN